MLSITKPKTAPHRHSFLWSAIITNHLYSMSYIQPQKK